MADVTFRVEQYEAALAPVMLPGESALWIPDASYLAGPSATTDPLGPAPTLAQLHETMEALVSGTVLVGFEHSLATTLRGAIDERHHGGVDGERVVTDQRLIVLDSLMHGAEVIWECPREAVVGARVTGGLGHAGRTIVVFSDGSGIVVLFGVLFRTGAEHFVAEFSRGLEIT
jgi:hypothetical protein